ncbi:hypothetical protein NDU88_000721 [Pleurodeles waltl]|uniref:PLAC domain-containing protein n=1 Tax=Pleurodeles waltl TaxID=8319 RepID=A0AAV7KR01_PLEWA|nr:hypothetical protein NDU88_000721 [Pleurodeles waltl]
MTPPRDRSTCTGDNMAAAPDRSKDRDDQMVVIKDWSKGGINKMTFVRDWRKPASIKMATKKHGNKGYSGKITSLRHWSKRLLFVGLFLALSTLLVHVCDAEREPNRRKSRQTLEVDGGGSKVPGVWSVWGPWSPCSQTCGLGIMERSRACLAPTADTSWGAGVEPHPPSVRTNSHRPFNEQNPGPFPYAARRPSYPLHTNGNAEVPPLLPSVPLHRHPEAYRPPPLGRFEPYPRHSRHQTFGRTEEGQPLLKPERHFNQRTSVLREPETEYRTEWGQHSNRDIYRPEGAPSQGTSYSRRAIHRESHSTAERRNVSGTMSLPLLRTPTKDSLPLFRPVHGELREISTGTFEKPANPHTHVLPAAPTKAPRHSHRSWAQGIIKPGKYGYGKLPFALSLHRQVGEAQRPRGQQENPLSRKQKRKAPHTSLAFSAEDSREKSPQSGRLLNVSSPGEDEGKNGEEKGPVAKDEASSTSRGMRLDNPTTHQKKEQSLTPDDLKGPSVHDALHHRRVNWTTEGLAVRKADRAKRQSKEEENKAAEPKHRIFLEDSSEEIDQDDMVENEKSQMHVDQSHEFLEEPPGEQLVSLTNHLMVPVVSSEHSSTIETLATTPAEAAEKEMSPASFSDGTWTSENEAVKFSPTNRSEEKSEKEAAPQQVDTASSREVSVINSDPQEAKTLNKSILAVALINVNSGQNTATLDGELDHQDGSIEYTITKSTTGASKLSRQVSLSNEENKKQSESLNKELNLREHVRTTDKPISTQQPKTHKPSPSRQSSHQQGPKQIQNVVKFPPRASSDLPSEEETRHRHRPPLTQLYSSPMAQHHTLSQTGQVARSRHQRQQGFRPSGFSSRHPHSIFRDPPTIQRPADPDTWLLQGENSALPHARGQGTSRDLHMSNEQQQWNLYHPGTESFHCEGTQKQYKACSQEPCAAGSVDSRAVQCATFDSQEFMGRLYQWEPFTEVQGYQRCELNCRPIGYRFYVRHTEKVQDGTPCEASSTDICVGGQCLRPGCDGILGSNKTLDDCGTCGGDGKACKLVVGIFNDTNVPIGYHKILQIPKGATKINVTEMTRSPNYLALRSRSGKSVINGNWAVDPPGTYPAAGTEFIYTRPGHEENSGGESFAAQGPITEALDVYMIFQQDNPGVSYRFFVSSEVDRSDNVLEQAHPDNLPVAARHTRPNSPSLPAHHARPDNPHVQARQARPVVHPLLEPQLPPRGSGALSQGSWSEVREPPTFATHPAKVSRNVAEGGQSGRPLGTLQRIVRVPPLPPPPIRNRAEPPEFYWKRVGTTECSVTCGKGFWLPIFRCVSRRSHEEVHEADCDATSRPVPSQEVCSTQPCPAFWDAGDWSACSKSCGPGMQHRQVLCRQMYANRTTMVHPQRCSQLEKPNVTQTCQLRICSHWEISTNWTTCSVMCGTGQRIRNVRCISNHGDVLSEGECSVRLRPKTSEACDMGPCIRSWFHDDWSRTCSTECGTGIQRRSVVCLSSEVGGESGEACTGSKPADMRACDGGPCSRVMLWYTGPWSQCSAECDDGTQRRDVICVSKLGSEFNVTDPSECGSLEKPPSLQPCNLGVCGARWYTTPWSACSRSCDGGHQVREVRCLTADKTFSRLCDLAAKPMEKRSCNTQMCALQLDENCKDKHQNCPLVVQARLCVYSYYKTSCCASCTRALERSPTPPTQ